MSPHWKYVSLLAILVAFGCRQESAPPTESATSTAPASDPAATNVELGAPTATPEPANAPPSESAPAPGAATGGATASRSTTAASQPPGGPASAGGVDLTHVSDQGALALLIRPQQALSNPVVQGIIAEMEAADSNFKFSARLDEMQQQLGADVNDMDHVLVVLDQQHLNMIPALGMMFMMGGMGPPMIEQSAPPEFSADPGTNCDDPAAQAFDAPPGGDFGPGADFGPGEAGGNPFAMPAPTVVIKFKREIDGRKLATAGGVQLEERTHGGKTYYFKAGDPSTDVDDSAAYMPDLTTAVFASEVKTKSMIDGQAGTAGPLAAVMAPLADKEFAVVLDVRPLHEFIGQMAQQNPAMAMAGGLVKQVNTLTLAADLQGANLLQLQLHTLNDGSAGGLQGMLGGFLVQGQNAMAQQIDANQAHFKESEKVLVPFAQKVLNASTVTAEGAICSITVPRPEGIEKLPEMIRPALKEAADAKSLNSLKQLALAFHNYSEVYRHFPSHGGSGNPEGQGQGLSWRVHLLPYVEEFGLYQEFHLDEPWDSEHNKSLIPRMPAVFGQNAEGKTSIHAFVGEGAPLDGDKGRYFSDITDGTSNTLLFVEAGPSTAEIWTKPGGLTFDPANPMAPLGDIGDLFGVVMMDGAARKLPKSIDPTTFKNLVQHADGNPVQLD